ncbi:hypothetical protein LZ30DRAFT_778891 [Colletotrichum cereale]|nr:hypothetical protein LZ30DRAFT_778891 [Colletotrichum cereale]
MERSGRLDTSTVLAGSLVLCSSCLSRNRDGDVRAPRLRNRIPQFSLVSVTTRPSSSNRASATRAPIAGTSPLAYKFERERLQLWGQLCRADDDARSVLHDAPGDTRNIILLGSVVTDLGWRRETVYSDAARVLLEHDLPDDDADGAVFAQELLQKVIQPLSSCLA